MLGSSAYRQRCSGTACQVCPTSTTGSFIILYYVAFKCSECYCLGSCVAILPHRHVTQTATISSRLRLRSGSSDRCEQPRTRLNFGQRAFSYAALAAWNSLPPTLQQMSNNDSFKRNLKHFCTSKLTLTSFVYLVQLIFMAHSLVFILVL